MRAIVSAAGGAAVASGQATRQRREAYAPPARASHNRSSAHRAAHGRRAWAPIAAAADAAGGAAAADEPAAVAPPPAAAQQQPAASVDYTKVPAFADFVYTVDGRCTLRVSGPLSTGTSKEQPLSDAARAAVLAAALVALRRRSNALDAALHLARKQFPDLLAAPMLKEFNRMQAAGEQAAALTVLTFGELFKLCEQVAPDVAQQIVEEIVEMGAELQASWLEPVPPEEASSAVGSSTAAGDSAAQQQQQAPAFRVKEGIDPVELLPNQLVRSVEWQLWQRRLRDAVIAWQRREAAEARRQQQAAEAAAEAGTGSSQAAASSTGSSQAAASSTSQAAAGQGSPAGAGAAAQPLQASYLINSSTPDEVAMRHELRITVPRTQGITLRSQLERQPFVLAQMVRDGVLARALYAPEPFQQRFLETAAFQLVRLGGQLTFSCTLPGAGEGSSSGSGSDSGSGSGSGTDFEFGGSVQDLQILVMTLAFLEGSTVGLDTFAWAPKDGRIQLRRLPPSSSDSWGQRQQPAEAASFELAVWPAAESGSGGAGAARAAAAQQGQPAVARLSQGQLNALLDCLDAFCKQHPALVQGVQDWDGPLWAPEPSWMQRMAALWQRPASGSAAEGAAEGAAGGSTAEGSAAEGAADGSAASSGGGEAGGGDVGGSSASSGGIALGDSAPGGTVRGTLV